MPTDMILPSNFSAGYQYIHFKCAYTPPDTEDGLGLADCLPVEHLFTTDGKPVCPRFVLLVSTGYLHTMIIYDIDAHKVYFKAMPSP